MLAAFLTAFIPLFVAMDAIGTLPIYLGLVEGHDRSKRRVILLQAVATAAIVGVSFIFLGKVVFGFLGITVADFKVAGGLILLILAITDLLVTGKKRREPLDSIAVVPLGMPLIVGPAVLTALIVQVDIVGGSITVTAFAVNLILAYIILMSSEGIVRVIGKSGAMGVSKVANLLMAAIAIMIIRTGLTEIIQNVQS